MPYTPYHFGPSGLIGIVFRRWLDLPIFVLANVLIDLEVAAMMAGLVEGSAHRVLHFHTLTLGGALGAAFGAGLYLVRPARRSLVWLMDKLHITYRPGLIRAAVSGLLGAWLHVGIDACYHHDVQPFWPVTDYRINGFLYRQLTMGNREISHHRIETICMALLALMIIAYAFAVRSYLKDKNHKPTIPKRENQK